MNQTPYTPLAITVCPVCNYRASSDYVERHGECPSCGCGLVDVPAERGTWDARTQTYAPTTYAEPPTDPALDTEPECCS